MATSHKNNSRKARKQSRKRKVKLANRSRRNKLTAPRTAKQYFGMSRQFQEMWDSLVQVPGLMRTEGLSLTSSSKKLHLKPREVLRLGGSAFRKGAGGRYVAKASDRLLRILVIPSEKGLIEIALRDSRQASLIGEYWSAVDRYLHTGDDSGIKRFKRIRITDANGRRVRLLTDLDELKRQASAGVLRFESLYGRTA